MHVWVEQIGNFVYFKTRVTLPSGEWKRRDCCYRNSDRSWKRHRREQFRATRLNSTPFSNTN